MMAPADFTAVLDREGYEYRVRGGRVFVTHRGPVDLSSLSCMPGGVVFCNGGAVDVRGMASVPEGVVFRNGGGVHLRGLAARLAARVVKTGRVTLADVQVLTGSGREDVRQHLAGLGIDLETIEDMPLAAAREVMAGTGCADRFDSFVGTAA